jgi:hypothetical protein
MDAFYASVEQRDDPALRGKPVIVGAPPTQRGVVCASSYEARKFGVRSAMPSATARRLCLTGIFVRPRIDYYREESRHIMQIVGGNRFVFCIEGYDSDPREIHLIPEVRCFYSAFHETWPYWLYFCNLDVDTLSAMTMCCLPDVSTMQVDGQTKMAVTCDPLHHLNFIRRDFMPMNAMCERGQMSERGIYDRSKAVFEHFGLPFDAKPPDSASTVWPWAWWLGASSSPPG